MFDENDSETVIFNTFSDKLVGAIPNFLNENT